MLVLTRQINETVLLLTSDGPIEVMLTKVDRGRARIGFIAPDSVKIYRKELLNQPEAEATA